MRALWMYKIQKESRGGLKMSRWLLFESEFRITVKIIRNWPIDKIIVYTHNLGNVHKETYKQVEEDLFSYIAKNREQLVRENKELFKKMKKLEVY